MYREEPYTGEDLPSKHLCLTYDDGPGKNTLQIAEFLFQQDIQATFFVVGKYAIENEEILNSVAALGHLIANHTFEHPDLPYYLSREGDVQNQVIRTDAVIGKYNKKNTIYFRSPYGKWSKEVADELNANILATINHIGPIYWDIAGIDCFYWKNNVTVEEATAKYLEDIKKKNHGIVVMHDEIADMEYLQIKNKTLQLTKQLIPKLKADGYKFVRLDEIKSIKDDAAKQLTITLKTTEGKYLYSTSNNTISIKADNDKSNKNFTIKDLGNSQFAFKAVTGLFLQVNKSKGNEVQATETEVTKAEKFDLIPLNSNKVLLRACNGNYLTIAPKSGSLTATAEFMRGAQIFLLTPTTLQERKSFSLSKKIRSLKRQLLYIKSKITQAV
ncbi:MAG TPA: polysaccharide deacetylase family protein [Segetibacter sp.]